MVRVGILTLLYKNYNYGGVLQAYALSSYLRSHGIDAKVVMYAGNKNVVYPTLKDKLQQYSKREIVKRIVAKCEDRINKSKIEEIILNRQRKFLYFEKESIPTTLVLNDQDLEKTNEEFDYFISGSDQVWNPNCAFELFLQGFVKDDKKKVAFAASISRNSLSNYEAEVMIPYIKRFAACSVRENTAKKILESYGVKDVSVVLDPTFLLKKEEWLQLIPNKKTENEYVLVYFFSDSKKYRKKIDEFCKKNSYDLYYIPYAKQEYISTDACGLGIPQNDVGPCEFLSLMQKAKYIFTDSFHGVALSINLEKEFIVVERDSRKSGASMNSRIIDVLKMFGLEKRLHTRSDSIEDAVIDRIDYDSVRNVLQAERKKSEIFILNALHGESDHNNSKNGSELDYYVPKQFYAAYAPKYALQSSSGGIFGSLAMQIIKDSGVVYGCGFDDLFNVVYCRIESEEKLKEICGSKYVRAVFPEGVSYASVLKDLQDKRRVLFSGVGCQIAGLQTYLKKNHQDSTNLLTVEVICHGVPSSENWRKYKEYMEKKYKAPLQAVNFRNKKYGWKEYSVSLQFANGRKYNRIMNANPYMLTYLSGYNVMEGCSMCKFKRNDRIADITLGDLWGIDIEEFDENNGNGNSLVVLNTEKANKIFSLKEDGIKAVKLKPEQIIVALSNMMGYCEQVSREKKNEFEEAMKQKGFIAAFKIWKKNNRVYYKKNLAKAVIKILRVKERRGL